MTNALSRLKRRREFVRASAHGRKAAVPGMVLQAVARDDGGADLRCGFTVSKRVGNAVIRNRARRRLKAVAGEIMPAQAMPGFDYVLIGRAGTPDRPYDALRRDLVAALKRLNLWRDGSAAANVPEREQS